MIIVRPVSGDVSDFTRPALMSAGVVPPIRGENTSFDSPNTPWQEAHFASHTCWPFSTLPDPGGRPLKSGRTSMSHALISAGVAARPTLGNWAPACAGATSKSVTPAQAGAQFLINLDILHLALRRHLPRLVGVVVVG